LPPMSILPVFGVTGLANFRFRCMRANLPGRHINTIDYQNGNYGPVIKVANGSFFGDVILEIIMSQNMAEKVLFNAWTDFVQPHSLYNTDVRYFDSYTGNLLINCYNSVGQINHICRLQNCFPYDMSEVGLSWDSQNQFVTFRVSMAYERYQTISPADLPGGLGDLLPLPEINLPDVLSITGATGTAANLASSFGSAV